MNTCGHKQRMILNVGGLKTCHKIWQLNYPWFMCSISPYWCQAIDLKILKMVIILINTCSLEQLAWLESSTKIQPSVAPGTSSPKQWTHLHFAAPAAAGRSYKHIVHQGSSCWKQEGIICLTSCKLWKVSKHSKLNIRTTFLLLSFFFKKKNKIYIYIGGLKGYLRYTKQIHIYFGVYPLSVDAEDS